MNTRKQGSTDLNRRKFIKSAATSAAAFTIVPRFVLGGSGHIAPSDTLYIGGIGVARGYLNRAELTAERFVSLSAIGDQYSVIGKSVISKDELNSEYLPLFTARAILLATCQMATLSSWAGSIIR